MKDGSYDTYNSGLMVSCAVLFIHKTVDIHTRSKYTFGYFTCGDFTCNIRVSNMDEIKSFLS